MAELVYWTGLAIGGLCAVVLLLVAIRGIWSPLRPLSLLRPAWKLALWAWWSHSTMFFLGLLLAFAGVALQLYFVLIPGFDETVLLVASIVWQAGLAALFAILVLPYHRFIIDRVVVPPNHEAPAGRPGFRSLPEGLIAKAAMFGFLIWLLNYGMLVLSRVAAAFAPDAAKGFIAYAVLLGPWLVVALLLLVRPALSYGLSARYGVKMALRHAPAIFLLVIIMEFAVVLANPAIGWLAGRMGSTNVDNAAAAMFMTAAFRVFYLFAMEALAIMIAGQALHVQAAEEGDQASSEQ